MANILTHYGLIPVKPVTNGKVVPLKYPDPGLIMGMELEIENTHSDFHRTGFDVTEDGSLRNNGREYVSHPMTYSVLQHYLSEFFVKNKLNESNYSERTSIHVHCNCQDLTFEQLASLLLIYQVFEKMLFQFVGAERDKNIFCVPLYECALSYQAVERLLAADAKVIHNWSKYSALNLLRLEDLGTVEFRHMPGTCDQGKITKWLGLIGCLFAFVRSHTITEIKEMFVNLNTSSQYKNVTQQVFGEYSTVWDIVPYESLLEDGVLNMKYSLIKQDKTKQMMYFTPPPTFFAAEPGLATAHGFGVQVDWDQERRRELERLRNLPEFRTRPRVEVAR